MPDQIVEITQTGLSLHKSRGFLQIKNSKEVLGQTSIDDIAAVIVSTPGCLLSTVLIDECCNHNIPVVICGRNYLPSSLVLPVSGQGRQFRTMQAQVNFSQPRRKRAWQRIVQAKIENQSAALVYAGKKNDGMKAIAARVRSGDPDNCEAHAARIYWQRLFGNQFRRDREAAGLNAALNYAYAILRACLARAVVSAGLHPSFSIHHINPQNPLNLVDDLMEPFRPMADCMVWLHMDALTGGLSPENKPLLSALINLTVPLNNGENSPLSLAAVRCCRAFANYCMAESGELVMPTLPSPLELNSIGADAVC